jgi:hypothetical protein
MRNAAKNCFHTTKEKKTKNKKRHFKKQITKNIRQTKNQKLKNHKKTKKMKSNRRPDSAERGLQAT